MSTRNTSKESIFHIEFNFKQKYMICLKKNWKNQIFSIFLSKSMLTTCLRLRVSLICAKKFEIWVNLCFGNILKLKVTKGELIISIQVEMRDKLWRWCPVRTPLSLIRVNFLLSPNEKNRSIAKALLAKFNIVAGAKAYEIKDRQVQCLKYCLFHMLLYVLGKYHLCLLSHVIPFCSFETAARQVY